MDKNYFPSNSDNRAAIILSSMSPDMVEAIGRLFSNHGTPSVKATIFGSKNATFSSPLAIFSSSYISDEDFDDVWLGVMTVLIGQMRKPNIGIDEYEGILKASYSLPSEMAASLASQIETRDIFSQAVKDAPWYSTWKNAISEGTRRILNYIPSLLQLPWEIDQTQDYDIDFLYEMKSLGRVIKDLNSRVRLMTAQSAVNSATGLLATGDIETGDIDEVETEVGDALSAISARQVPPRIFGTTGKIAYLGMKTNAEKIAAVTKAASDDSQPEKQVVAKNIISKISNMKPSKAMLIGGGLGVAAALIKSLLEKKKAGKGDIDEAVYGDVRDEYGDTIADAWAEGDIEGIVGEALGDILDDASTGDVELDEQILGDVLTDVDDSLDPEVGGLLSRWRTNRNIKRARIRRRKMMRRDNRQKRRDEALKARLRSEQQLDDNAYSNMDDQSPDYSDESGNQDDAYGIDNYNWGAEPQE